MLVHTEMFLLLHWYRAASGLLSRSPDVGQSMLGNCSNCGHSLDPKDVVCKGPIFARFWKLLCFAGICWQVRSGCSVQCLKMHSDDCSVLKVPSPTLWDHCLACTIQENLWGRFYPHPLGCVCPFSLVCGILGFTDQRSVLHECGWATPSCLLLNVWEVADGWFWWHCQIELTGGFLMFFSLLFFNLFCGHSDVATRSSLPSHANMLSCSLIVIWVNVALPNSHVVILGMGGTQAWAAEGSGSSSEISPQEKRFMQISALWFQFF